MVQADVIRWRTDVAAHVRRPFVGRTVRGAFEWDESLGAPYFTDKPGWWGYGGLVTLALRDDGGPSDAGTLSEQWVLRYLGHPRAGAKRYAHLPGAITWLPVDFDRPFRDRWPAKNDAWLGSSVHLAEELDELNRRTYGADASQLAEWRKGEGPHSLADWSVEQMAQHGLALFIEFANKSVRHHLPMDIDY